MRQRRRFGSTLLSGGMLVLVAAACGHKEIPQPGGGSGSTSTPTAGTGSPSGGGAGLTPGSGGSPSGSGAVPGAQGGTPSTPGGGTSPNGGGQNPAAGAGGGSSPPPATSCTDAASQLFDPKTMPGNEFTVDPMAQQLFSQLNQQQKILQMSGVPVGNKDYQDIFRSPDVPVGGVTVRGYRYRDGGHGVNLDAPQDNRAHGAGNFSTAFPQASTRGASFDLDLEWRLGEAMGAETAASKNNVLLAPCMNIIRHPYWGRTQETYGEDMYHIGRMATAYTAGVQQYVAACAKHYAANNVETNRANQDAVMDEQTLREVYGRHFEMVVKDSGVACVMAAYNKINGVKLTQNKHVLTDVLRTDFGFRGFVLSDWWAMPGGDTDISASTATAVSGEAALAGLDIELPWTLNFGQLGAAITANPSVAAAVDAAAKRILEQKFRFKSALSTDGWALKQPTVTLAADGSIATHQAHLDLAEEAATESAVLLKNGPPGMPVLPISTGKKIAVIGAEVSFSLQSTTPPPSGTTFRFATDVANGDRGSSRVNADPAQSVGPTKGLQDVGASKGATVTSGTTAAAAAAADIAVVVVGLTPGDEGEEYAIAAGGDRTSLDLVANQNQLVASVLDLNKPTVIIIQAGSIVNLPWLTHPNQQQATIWAGYAGMRAGLAYAKLLFGDANFSGKMPMAWPKQTDLQPFREQANVTNMGYFFGYREYDRRAASGTPVELVFPFGHGLSYSTFTYSGLSVPCGEVTKKGIINVTVNISNTSAVPGAETALLFIKPPAPPAGTTGKRPVKELKSFAKVSVPAMGMATANLPVRIQDLRRWEGGANGKWVIDNGTYTVLVGPNGNEANLTQMGTFTVKD